jgi:hypothetical protein
MSKNNKKSFSDNLASIFAHTLNEDNQQDNPKFLSKSNEEEEMLIAVLEGPSEEKEKNVQKKVHRKSFSEGLESFFKDSIEEVIGDGTVTEVKRGVSKKGNKRVVGIEVLLQSTLFKDFEKDLQQSNERFQKTKRVTFVLDTDKVELLKNKARVEKKEMRQIVSSLIEDYLIAEGIIKVKEPSKKTTTKKEGKSKK